MSKPAGAPGFSPQGLEALTARMQADIDAGRIPGVVMAITHRGQTVYRQALGTQDPSNAAPMSFDTIFRIYSMTKPIVSLAAMMLVEQGRMLLSDPIDSVLPELAGLQVGVERPGADGSLVLALEPARQPITLQDLLRHTAGFTYGIFGDSLVKAEYRKAGLGTPRAGSDEFMRTLGELPLMYQPGMVWEYSHATDVLGVLVERLCGQSLDECLQQRIFGPLAMRDTGFWVEPAQQHRIAEAFATDPVTGAAVRLNQPRRRPAFLGGGGGLMSTAADFLRFAQMLANGGTLDGVRLVGRKTLDLMTADHLGEMALARSGLNYLPGPGYGFGLGFAVRKGEGNAVIPGSPGDYTWSGLAGTYFWVDPREELVAVLLMQAPEQRNHYRQMFRHLVYAALA